MNKYKYLSKHLQKKAPVNPFLEENVEDKHSEVTSREDKPSEVVNSWQIFTQKTNSNVVNQSPTLIVQQKEDAPSKKPESVLSIISPTMVIQGDIVTEAPLLIKGVVHGSITSQDIVSSKHGSRIHGDINAKTISLFGTTVTGDIVCQDYVELGDGSTLLGNIQAHSVLIAGKVDGHINATGHVRLTSTAIVYGNLKASNFTVENGAILKGSCQIQQDQLELSPTNYTPVQNT